MRLISTVAVLVLLAAAVPPGAAAQARPRGEAPAEGRAVPRGSAPAPAPPRSSGAQRPQAPAPSTPPPARASRPPQRQSAAPPPSRRVEIPQRAVPRTQPRVIVPGNDRRNDLPIYRPDYRPAYRPDYRPRYRPDYRPYYVAPYRPRFSAYYIFRPRVRVTTHVWVGFPVVYPYYVDPYSRAYPYAYPSPYTAPSRYPFGTPPYPVTVQPGTPVAAPGALSFDIRPGDADLFVDGYYVGTVGQFTPEQPPLWLTPGRHLVEIREPGYEDVVFEVDIVPGQVLPYHGELARRF